MREASELALGLAALVADEQAFSDEAAEDLHRILSHRLASPSAGTLRYDRLWLLLELLLTDGLVPTFDEYERARRAHSRDAPAGSTLINAYGHWLTACRAATRFLGSGGSHARVSHSHAHTSANARYEPRECIDSVTRFRRRFGQWASHTEYAHWVRLERLAARLAGAPDPRLAGLGAITRNFGSYARALTAAQAAWREPPTPTGKDER